MSEMYSKVEIVTPRWTADKWFAKFFGALFGIAFRVLIVWWAVAAWFPEMGLTYWQMVLPVYAIRTLFTSNPFTPRILNK